MAVKNTDRMLDLSRDLLASGVPKYGVGGRRNLIINGGFDVWQRGTSFTSVPNGDFTADRWGVWFGTPNVSKGTLDTTYGNVLEITGTSTTGVYFTQRIEHPEIHQNKTLTVSFYAKASSAVNINQKIRVAHTGGNYDRDTIANFDLTTNWQRYSYTFLVNDSGGSLSFDSSSYIDVQIISNSDINGITVSFAQVQVEPGDTATPFEYRSYGEELALCQRYYQRYSTTSGTSPLFTGVATVGTQLKVSITPYGGLMRIKPAVTLPGAAAGNQLAKGNGTASNITAVSVANQGGMGHTYDFTSSGLTANHIYYVTGAIGSGAALELDAEL